MKEQSKTLWAVMKAHSWASLSIGGVELAAPEDGPCRFIPVFDTREKAVAWAGSDENVRELSVGE